MLAALRHRAASALPDGRARVVLLVSPGRAGLAAHVYVLLLAAIALGQLSALRTRCRPPAPSPSTPRCASAPRRATRIPSSSGSSGRSSLGTRDRLRPPLPAAARLRADRRRAAGGPARDRPRREPGRRAPRARRRRLGDRPRRPRAAARALRRRARHRLAAARRRRPGGALMELAQVQEHATRILDEVERAVIGKRERARARPDGDARRRARPARGLSRAREDAHRALVRAGDAASASTGSSSRPT